MKRILLLGIGAALLVSSTANAEHLRGIKASATSVNDGTGQVDLDVTINTYYTPNTTIPDSTDMGFVQTYTSYSYTTFSFAAVKFYAFANFPAISWGDGDRQSFTSIPAVSAGPPGVYQGSFSHNYGSPGQKTIFVSTNESVGYATSSNDNGPITTGNPGARHTFISYSFGASSFYIYNITNTAQATVEFVYSDWVNVPTASEFGLGLLAVALAGAGLFLLRR